MRVYILGLVGVLLALPAHAEEPEKSKLLVTNIAVEEGVSESVARLLNDLLMAELQKAGPWEVVGQSDIEAMVELEQQRQLAGCDSVTCIAEIGGALGAERVLTSSVGAVGDLYVLNLKLVNTAKVVVEARWSDSVAGEQSVLVATIRRAVAELIGQRDGPTAAETPPTAPVAEGAPPPEQPGLAATQPPAVEAATAEPALYERWWFWTGIGAVVVGGVVLVALTAGGGSSRADVVVGVTLPEP